MTENSALPSSWPAWCVSLTVHACFLLLMFFLLRQHFVEGSAEVPLRDVGIVLKKMSDDGPLFLEETEETQQLEYQESQMAEANRSLSALPMLAEVPASLSAADPPQVIGGGAIEMGQIGSAESMTQGGGASRSVGGKTTVRVFGVEGTGSKFVYVFDRSISMEGSPLRAAKQQLIASFESLDSIHQFQIVFFNHEVQSWDLTGGQQRIAFATDSNKHSAEKFVRGITASGGTYRLEALRRALGYRPDVIFFLTDTDDPMPPQDTSRLIRRANHGGVAVNTIEFGVGRSTSRDNFLIQLAQGSGGQYVYVDTQKLSPRAR